MKSLPGKELACEYDQLGPVRVFDDGTKRYLTFGNGDEQSCLLKAQPQLLQYDYNRAMALVLPLYQHLHQATPKSIGLFGLGGGSLVNCLSHHVKDASLTAVELREAVISIAQKHFLTHDDSRLNIIHSDALSYVNQLEDARFEVLFSDLFIGEGLEARQLTYQFIEQTKRVLSADGWLVINALDEYRTEKVLQTLIGRYFNAIYENVTDDGNWVIIAGNTPHQPNPKDLYPQAKAWSTTLGFSMQRHLKRLQLC